MYSGLPVSLGGLDLHTVYRKSVVPYSSLDPSQRRLVDQQDVRSRAGVMDLAERLGMFP